MSKKPQISLLNISTDLIAGVLIGLIGGFYIDKWLATKPLFIIIGLVIGTLAAFRMIWREMNKNIEN